MRLNRLVFALCFFTFSLCTRHEDDQKKKSDAAKIVVLNSKAMIDGIASLSDNKKIKLYVDAMYFDSQKNISQNFACLCTVIDWSLKDFKTVCSLHDHALVLKILRKSIKNQTITTNQLLAMQRHNRAQVKDIIFQLKHVYESDSLQVSLQELYHALHEVKKQIVTIDKVSAVSAWYIYVTLLFLDLILMQGLQGIECSMQKKVEQQALIHQLVCIVERFKHIVLSDFTI